MKDIPQIRLFGLAQYDRGAKARWLLTEMKVPFEVHWLSRDKKEHETPEYLKLNPMGRVPVMQFGDAVIFESGAIVAHLADHFRDQGMAPAPSSVERAEYLKWMYFAASTIDPIVAKIMIIEDIPEGEVRTTKESALLSDLRDALNTLSLTLEKRPYLVSDRFTAADICVSYHLYWCTLWPELDEVIRQFPRVASYLERLKKMPSAIEAKAFSYTA